MSNIRSNGKELFRNEQDYRVFYYPQDNQVIGYRRMYVDGQETNAWASDSYDTPQKAVQVLPGLREKLESISEAKGVTRTELRKFQQGTLRRFVMMFMLIAFFIGLVIAWIVPGVVMWLLSLVLLVVVALVFEAHIRRSKWARKVWRACEEVARG